MDARAWCVTLAAAALMALVVGGRSSFGLFVSPLNGASGLGLANLSLALALGQLAIGLAQPAIGALADRLGAARVIACGAAALAASTALPAWWPHPAVVAASMVLVALAGSAVASNGLLVGEVQRAVPAARAGFAIGVVGAGMSVGLLVLGPLTQWAIDGWGWARALLATAAMSAVAWLLAPAFRRRAPGPTRRGPGDHPGTGGGIVARALRRASFWRVAASFGVCGFQVTFLAVHMPGVIERCGLPAQLAGQWVAVYGAANAVGSLAIGWALRRGDAARWLAAMYGVRALGVTAMLLLPASPWSMFAFAVLMGASFMAILPPTAQLIAREFGAERLGTLMGVVMLVHQVGGFVGVWLGGWAAEATGSDQALWAASLALALAAAALVWPWGARRCALPAAGAPA
ncbi:MAG: MFS transporter [Rubrivivax sp.]|nr:MFS transporter [Rubrivivax sp.]